MDWKFTVIFFQFGFLVVGKMVLVIQDSLIKCDEYEGEKRAHIFDMSSIELIPINDTHTYLNGTLQFLQDIHHGWKARVYIEQRRQNQWQIQAFDRTYKDLCDNLAMLKEPFYPYIEHMKKCPLKAGDEWFFDMAVIKLDEKLMSMIPSHYTGEWRGTFLGIFHVDDVEKYECKRGFGNIYDI
ncbi:hypothetical protein PVAND_006376 [Polypedilum vanderplanki]|uniref:Uncharacterized protein n=1 Tax=Polypedilum vanderplanki TaxID=319348 RepID=A0A9J6C3F8_POLVA|nr:hypothetical protein PVAND_006376 [Polypedilum vanderplanki]